MQKVKKGGKLLDWRCGSVETCRKAALLDEAVRSQLAEAL